MNIDYSKLPLHMQDGTRRYIENGIPPGGFLSAVICNDLSGAYSKADHHNRTVIEDWFRFFHNDAPADCSGSVDAFNDWCSSGGTMKGVMT